ncbi:MAG: hypothetical protein Q7T79_01065 [bacterium]|nr:hypothetical protein [bacterium]
MQNQLQRAINLSKKTGDKLIIFDSAKAEETCIVLPLKDYENLVLNKSEIKNLTEDELLDKVNCDIAIWKNEQDNKVGGEKNDKISSAIYNEDQFEVEEKDDDFNWSSDDQLNKKTGKSWSIPSTRKKNAEDVIEEDRQYLEEVTF